MATATIQPDSELHYWIDNRKQTLVELQKFKEVESYDDFTKRRNREDKATLDNALRIAENEIIQLTKFAYPNYVVIDREVEIAREDGTKEKVIIYNVSAIVLNLIRNVPKPKEEPKKRIFHPGR